MTRREYEERMLADAEAFLEKMGLTQQVQEFLKSETAVRIANESFSAMMGEVEEFKKNAPEELKERAQKIFDEFNGAKSNFDKDAEANFKLRISMSFSLLPQNVQKALQESGILLNALYEGEDAFAKDYEEICTDMVKHHIESYMEILYQDYVPQGVPAEIASFIKHICGGGVMIPFTAIFPENDEDDNKEE